MKIMSLAAALALLSSPALRADETPAEPKAAETAEVKLQDITLTVPKTWKQAEPTSRLRLGEFSVPAAEGDDSAAELAIFYFGGGGGTVQANLQRWVGQFSEDDRETSVKMGKSPQGSYIILDVTGTYNKPIGPPIQQKTEKAEGYRMLALILNIEGKGNYFLKLTGPKKTVDASAEALRASIGAKAADEKPLEDSAEKE